MCVGGGVVLPKTFIVPSSILFCKEVNFLISKLVSPKNIENVSRLFENVNMFGGVINSYGGIFQYRQRHFPNINWTLFVNTNTINFTNDKEFTLFLWP